MPLPWLCHAFKTKLKTSGLLHFEIFVLLSLSPAVLQRIQIVGKRVKSGKFGRSAKFGQRPCLFRILIIGLRKLINLANSENPEETVHNEPSHLDFHCLQMFVQIYLMSEVTRLYRIKGTRVF